MENKNNWYKSLISEVNSLSEELGLDDPSSNKLRSFVVDRAKEQYRRGNRNGAIWAFKKSEQKATASQ